MGFDPLGGLAQMPVIMDKKGGVLKTGKSRDSKKQYDKNLSGEVPVWCGGRIVMLQYGFAGKGEIRIPLDPVFLGLQDLGYQFFYVPVWSQYGLCAFAGWQSPINSTEQEDGCQSEKCGEVISHGRREPGGINNRINHRLRKLRFRIFVKTPGFV